MDMLIDALLEWIAANSAYETRTMVHPVVLELSPQDLTREFYSGAPQLIPTGGIDDRVLGLYAPDDGSHGTIYLLAPANVADAEFFDVPEDNPIFREMLLHELIHHAQWQSGTAATWPCDKIGESEAYLLGGRWLKQRGVTDPIPNRNFWAHVYTAC